MNDQAERRVQLQSEIKQLRAAIASLSMLPDARRPLEAQLTEKERQLAALEASASKSLAAPTINSPSALRDVNIATQQVINNFFDDAPGERGIDLLNDYLDTLADDCDQLRLTRLRERRQSGAERRTAPALRLQAVYTSLTTNGENVQAGKRHVRPLGRIRQIVARLHRRQPFAERCSPEYARGVHIGGQEQDAIDYTCAPDAFGRIEVDTLFHDRLPDDMTLSFNLTRPELAIEAIHAERRLVLLGEPGYGKSTVLRYLALLLARRIRGATVDLFGWPPDELPIPILCPLGSVAAALDAHGGDADKALWQALGDVLDGPQGISAGLSDFLKPALRRGGVLLLLDGLDELPTGANNDGPRRRVAAAVQRLAGRTRARIVVTSRVLPYRAAPDWQFPAEESWAERTIQPLAFGQVRTFVHGWYAALAPSDPDLTAERAETRAEALIGELAANQRMRPLVQSPLLLTMLALLHYNSDGEIPRDRARLYHECVQLLLERWEPVRTPGLHGRTSRLQQLLARLPGLETDKLRDLLHALAFEAHDAPPGDDGRGQIDRYRLTGRLIEFFKRLGSSEPSAHADTFLEVVREEAGLLVARDDETAFVFPHLTFQEYLAACWLAEQPDMIEQAYKRWQSDDRERWRQVLLLLAGRLRQKGQKDIERDGVPWLDMLSSATARGQAKDATQRRRDAVLAAFSYAEMGERAALATSMRDLVTQVETPLRQAIIHLLEAADPAIGAEDRIAAARILARLGDPRCPVELAQWRNEPFPADFGGTGYWRALLAGTYTIGGWEEGEKRVKLKLPSFWIARYPITVAQYAQFVDAGGYGAKAERWWTKQGWQWKRRGSETVEPHRWGELSYHRENQPMRALSWYEATAFCAWLNEQLANSLPSGYELRLPSEAEWEAAASFAPGKMRRDYPWGANEPTPERAIYDASGLSMPAPVGCCPAGAAACGALDMAGNVWEWCASDWKSYPQGSAKEQKDLTAGDWVVLRGGSYHQDRTSVRCGARYGCVPDLRYFSNGFRIVVAARDP